MRNDDLDTRHCYECLVPAEAETLYGSPDGGWLCETCLADYL